MPRSSIWTPNFAAEPATRQFLRVNAYAQQMTASIGAVGMVDSGVAGSVWSEGAKVEIVSSQQSSVFIINMLFMASAVMPSGGLGTATLQLNLYAGASGLERRIAAWKTLRTSASSTTGFSHKKQTTKPFWLPFPIYIPAGTRLSASISHKINLTQHDVTSNMAFDIMQEYAVTDVYPTHVVDPIRRGTISYQPLSMDADSDGIKNAVPWDCYITSLAPMTNHSSTAATFAVTIRKGQSGSEYGIAEFCYGEGEPSGTVNMANDPIQTIPMFVEAGSRLTSLNTGGTSGTVDLNVVRTADVIPIGAL